MMLDFLSLAVGITIGVTVFGFSILIYGLLREKNKKDEIDRNDKIAGLISEKRIDEIRSEEKLNSFMSRLENITEDYHIIAEYIGILNAIQDLGGFVAPYENFLEDVEEEIRILEKGEIRGPEYFRRSHQLKFALYMALVYARVRGTWDMIPEIRAYLERARVL